MAYTRAVLALSLIRYFLYGESQQGQSITAQNDRRPLSITAVRRREAVPGPRGRAHPPRTLGRVDRDTPALVKAAREIELQRGRC